MKKLSEKTARIIFAIPFAIFGLFHFISAKEMAGFMVGWPAAEFFVYLSGAGMIAAAVAIIINKYARLASLLLAGELLTFILAIQLPMLSNPEMSQMAITGVLKDLSLIGGALMVAGILDNNVSRVTRKTAISN